MNLSDWTIRELYNVLLKPKRDAVYDPRVMIYISVYDVGTFQKTYVIPGSEFDKDINADAEYAKLHPGEY